MKNLNFGDYIKNRRLELKKTQASLAEELKVSQNFVTYLETGQRKPSEEMVNKLSAVLRLPMNKLYFAANPQVKSMIGFDEEREAFQDQKSPVLVELEKDKPLRGRHEITDEEIEQLASLRLRGDVKNKEDYVFLLMSIRQVLK